MAYPGPPKSRLKFKGSAQAAPAKPSATTTIRCVLRNILCVSFWSTAAAQRLPFVTGDLYVNCIGGDTSTI